MTSELHQKISSLRHLLERQGHVATRLKRSKKKYYLSYRDPFGEHPDRRQLILLPNQSIADEVRELLQEWRHERQLYASARRKRQIFRRAKKKSPRVKSKVGVAMLIVSTPDVTLAGFVRTRAAAPRSPSGESGRKFVASTVVSSETPANAVEAGVTGPDARLALGD